MNLPLNNYLLILAIPLALPCEGLAEPKRVSPELEVSVARVQESSIVLEESDTVVESADGAYSSEAIIGVDLQPNQRLSVAARYVRSETRYETFTAFDLLTQVVSGSAAYSFDKFTIGVDAFAADANLAGENYLQLQHTGPTLGLQLSRHFYLQTALTHIEKEFAENTERNTLGPQVGGRLYYLLNGTDHYFLLNYKHRKEDAESAIFDSSAHSWALSWRRKQNVFGKALDMSLRISQEEQTFSPAQRKDQVWELQTAVTLHLNHHIYVKLSFQHLDNGSTDDTLDYQQRRAEARIGFYL